MTKKEKVLLLQVIDNLMADGDGDFARSIDTLLKLAGHKEGYAPCNARNAQGKTINILDITSKIDITDHSGEDTTSLFGTSSWLKQD